MKFREVPRLTGEALTNARRSGEGSLVKTGLHTVGNFSLIAAGALADRREAHRQADAANAAGLPAQETTAGKHFLRAAGLAGTSALLFVAQRANQSSEGEGLGHELGQTQTSVVITAGATLAAAGALTELAAGVEQLRK